VAPAARSTRRLQAGSGGWNPTDDGRLWIFDPNGAYLSNAKLLQGFSFVQPPILEPLQEFLPILENTRNRAIRIVEEYPSVVFPLYTFDDPLGPPSGWQVVWRVLDEDPNNRFANGLHWFPIGTVRNAVTDKVVGVGVVRVTAHNAHGYDWAAGKDAYFIYVLRRHADESVGHVSVVDHIDLYVFEYDHAVRASSRMVVGPNAGGVLLLKEVSFQVPVVSAGPPPRTHAGLGDDENYLDPDGNPCIALSMVRTPLDNPNEKEGAICVFQFHYSDYAGDIAPPVCTLDMLTPTGPAPDVVAAPRKDPEVVPLKDQSGTITKIYIYNRERQALDDPAADWELHRTLAWG